LEGADRLVPLSRRTLDAPIAVPPRSAAQIDGPEGQA